MIHITIWPGIEIVCEGAPRGPGVPESAAFLLDEPFWRALVHNTDPRAPLQVAHGPLAMTTDGAIAGLADFLAWRDPRSGG